MKLHELIQDLPVKAQAVPSVGVTAADPEITAIVEDSRQATPGCAFIARAGTKTDGRQYIADALVAGAVAILCDEASLDGVIGDWSMVIGDPATNQPGTNRRPLPIAHCPVLLSCRDVAHTSALLAERFYGYPTDGLSLVGITGTNGKTTIAYLVRHLLCSAGIRCGLIGTVEIDDGRMTAPANLTTPPAIELSRMMRDMVNHGCRACAMEASSHALHQHRTAGLHFRIGVFTNLTGDHLDYHKTMEAYLDAKAILFEGLPPDGYAILNDDDEASQHMARRTRAKIITCSQRNAQAMCYAKVGEQRLGYVETMFAGPWGKFECRLPLIGRHNVSNALQALAVGHTMGLDRESLRDGIATCKAPPGRLEPVTAGAAGADGFAVLVDYAHTDDALENVLRALRPVVPSGGKLRVVFGCGGDRDRTKRPRMAKVACRYADDVIVTSDNPRTEDPEAIIDEIITGVPHDRLGNVLRIVDRAQAIHAAIERTGDGDIVLIAGKGHEDYQIIGTTKRPFDDRLIAAEALAKRPKVQTSKRQNRKPAESPEPTADSQAGAVA